MSEFVTAELIHSIGIILLAIGQVFNTWSIWMLRRQMGYVSILKRLRDGE